MFQLKFGCFTAHILGLFFQIYCWSFNNNKKLQKCSPQ